MDIGNAIYTQLSNDATVGPIVADGTYGPHIYPLVSVQNLYPMIAYTFTDETPQHLSNDLPVLFGPFMTTIIVATMDYNTTQTLATAVFDCMNKQQFNDGTTQIHSCTYQHDSQDEISQVSNAEKVWWEQEMVFKIYAYQP